MTVCDDNESQPGRPVSDSEVIHATLTVLFDVQTDIRALREEMVSLRAAIADLHRRLRLIAGW